MKESRPALSEVFKERRKWQIALRRYILNKQMSFFYAPYFAIDIESFRRWIELQFDHETTWESFGKNWQFDHVVPVAYFNFKEESDLKLCWNFTNIRLQKSPSKSEEANRIDTLTAKAYFEGVFSATGYLICYDMIRKIETIEISQIKSNNNLERFIIGNYLYLDTLRSYSSYEFERLNSGNTMQEIETEKAMLKKFG